MTFYKSREQGDKARVIQSLLFMSGINTLLQTWFGTRLPTVMGPSFAYIISVLAIINDFSDSTFANEHEVRSGGSTFILVSLHDYISFYIFDGCTSKEWQTSPFLFSLFELVSLFLMVFGSFNAQSLSSSFHVFPFLLTFNILFNCF